MCNAEFENNNHFEAVLMDEAIFELDLKLHGRTGR
jgi:hypothetical protein